MSRQWSGATVRTFAGVAVGLASLCLVVLGALAGGSEIVGDEGFHLLPGVTGLGTIQDPYVISGVFDAEGQPFALRIRNTRAHFVVENAVLRGASEAGLWLENVTNGWVVACVFEKNHTGVRVEGDVADVTFTLNTFGDNVQHVVGSASAIRWDDGRVGNWWAGYLGTDANGDGIGDAPREVVPATEAAEAQRDRFPLVAPLAGVAPPEGAVLLQVRAEVGDRQVSEVEMTMTFGMTIMGERIPAEMEGRMVAEQEVMERHGGGSSFVARLTILEDTGTATVAGEVEEYVSDAGKVSWMRLFRFGGFEALEEDVPATIPVFELGWPARWMSVGDTWTHVAEASADTLGIPGGTARFHTAFKLDRIEERDGRAVAVLTLEGELDIGGGEEDPFLLGPTEFVMEGTFSGLSVVDLGSGHSVESALTLAFSGDIKASGSRIGTMDVQISVTGRDRALGVPPAPAEEADLQRQMEVRLDELAARVVALEERVQDLEKKLAELAAPPALRIAVVDAEALFTRVFLPQVQMERAAMEAKARDIQTLQDDYAAGRIRLGQYQQRYLRLQAELIQASLRVNLAMLDKMIASPGFLNLKADLEGLRVQATPLETEVQAVVREAQVTIRDLAGFEERLQRLEAAFQQLDQLLTQIAAAKILEITQQVAREQGYDIVLRTKDVVMFRREATVSDLSPEVEVRLWALFPVR